MKKGSGRKYLSTLSKCVFVMLVGGRQETLESMTASGGRNPAQTSFVMRTISVKGSAAATSVIGNLILASI